MNMQNVSMSNRISEEAPQSKPQATDNTQATNEESAVERKHANELKREAEGTACTL